MTSPLEQLKSKLSGELFSDDLHTSIYATDASVYRMLPKAVAYPKTLGDLKLLIQFAHEHETTLIPRTAGTSLAGQCVGDGIVVDVSKHFTKIISVDEKLKTVTVQPGVIRDDLNLFLKPYGLFFGPNTSTSNRCMIGGMVGNNSSGTTSIKYGVTREKLIHIKTLLSDGSEVEFSSVSTQEFLQKTTLDTLEGSIYNCIHKELSNEDTQREIREQFPKETIHRRNTGYNIDAFLKSELFGGDEKEINLCELLSGSEGTLAFTTEITLQLDDLPPEHSIMVCAHFESVQESMEAVVIAMKHNLYLCELMDKTILDCTKNNREHTKNRFFIEGDPQAVLMLQLSATTIEKVEHQAEILINELKEKDYGFAFPKLTGMDIEKAFNLRKAGLGLLGNIIGDDKAVACIEDTAVELEDLPNYISEFTQMMEEFQQKAVYYAHAGAGELHLRPILNLKKSKDVELFRKITLKTALLVKKYNGSFSGEHGDGIVRAEFIPIMIGTKNYKLLQRLKKTFDENHVFNKGKITDPFLMDSSLRYEIDRAEPAIESMYNFSDSQGILRATEKCNGSGDCRKSVSAGGTMCPSYRGTKNEKDTTRARANALREFLTNSKKPNKFNHKELKEVFDLCLSCKACASECPSNVDVAVLKSEFLYQYYKSNSPSFRDQLFAFNAKYNKIGSRLPRLTNFILQQPVVKKALGIASERSIPTLSKETFRDWIHRENASFKSGNDCKGIVYLFCDEFTNYNDIETGIDTYILLQKLGYTIKTIAHEESGRSLVSKGFLDEFKSIANTNISLFKNLITKDTPLIGIEPTAILTFKDEYLRIADDHSAAVEIAKHCYSIEEFIQNEINKKNILPSQFTKEEKNIKIHGHCHQKALIGLEPIFSMLNLPKNYSVSILSSGCCGMAGSFGYEKEKYALSMKIGEDSLFPKIRKLNSETLVATSGTSCKHQILDGTGRKTMHPSTILLQALLS